MALVSLPIQSSYIGYACCDKTHCYRKGHLSCQFALQPDEKILKIKVSLKACKFHTQGTTYL